MKKKKSTGSSKKTKTVVETDKKLHGLKKNKNKFCHRHKCKLIDTCWKGRAAAIALCEDYV